MDFYFNFQQLLCISVQSETDHFISNLAKVQLGFIHAFIRPITKLSTQMQTSCINLFHMKMLFFHIFLLVHFEFNFTTNLIAPWQSFISKIFLTQKFEKRIVQHICRILDTATRPVVKYYINLTKKEIMETRVFTSQVKYTCF